MVHPDDAGFETPGCLEGLVTSPELTPAARRSRVVGQFDHVVLALQENGVHDWTEDFVLHRGMVVVDIVDNGRFVERTAGERLVVGCVPPVRMVAPLSRAASTNSFVRWTCSSETFGPMSVSSRSGSPTVMPDAALVNVSRNCRQISERTIGSLRLSTRR